MRKGFHMTKAQKGLLCRRIAEEHDWSWREECNDENCRAVFVGHWHGDNGDCCFDLEKQPPNYLDSDEANCQLLDDFTLNAPIGLVCEAKQRLALYVGEQRREYAALEWARWKQISLEGIE